MLDMKLLLRVDTDRGGVMDAPGVGRGGGGGGT